ncbi:MAG: tetratricopeptide repeat protein [Caldithrix sp.]|nr:tetratricopeptide repeat protein [Caldithrix sp.]
MSEREKTDIAKGFFEQGYVAQMSGHLDRAAGFYKRSIKFLPTAKAHTFLGWVYSLKGFPEKGIEECKKAIELDPAFGNPYNDIGAYLIQMRRYDEAKPWLERALRAPRYKNYAYPHINLGKIYEFKGLWDQAMYHYKKAIKEAPDYEPAYTARDRLEGKYN